MKGFDRFCIDKNYVKIKNSLFNYLNRKKSVRDLFYKFYNKEKSLIDIGSGLSPISPVPEKTLFIDISREGLFYLENQGYKTKYGSIAKIPLESNSIDIIFCSEVLEHVDNYNKAFKEMNRVLKRRGKLILTVPVHKKYWSFDDEFVGHYRRFEPDEFEEEIRRSGFKIIENMPIGSRIERIMTKLAVKLFKNQKDKKEFGQVKLFFSVLINYILYLIVRLSLLFTTKESTSIMIYLCEK